MRGFLATEQRTHKPLLGSPNLPLGTQDHPARWSFCFVLTGKAGFRKQLPEITGDFFLAWGQSKRNRHLLYKDLYTDTLENMLKNDVPLLYE